jgi:hypothetical protein
MNFRKSFLLLSVVTLFSLSSCSGPKGGGCVTNCGGNATVSITIFDTPPSGVSLLSFTLPISQLALTPSSGSAVSLTAAVSSVEATRLQTDSALIVDNASVVAGSYTSLSIILGPTTSSSNAFINTSGSTISWSGGSCANGAACYLPAGSKVAVTVPLTLTLSSGQSQWIGLNLNLANAITTSGGISVDFSQSNVLTATTTTRAGIPSGAVDTIEDFVGQVTAYSAGSSITVKSGISGQSLTASLTSNSEYDAPSSSTGYTGCNAAPSCISVGSTVSLDAQLNSNGTLTATDVDVLDVTATDEVEGVIYPTGQTGVWGMILSDKESLSGNSVLSASTTTYGTPIFLDVSSGNPVFYVDTKTLTSVAALNNLNVSAFRGTSDLLAGQVVRARVSSVTLVGNQNNAVAKNVLLRLSRLTGAVSNVTSVSFDFTPPGYVTAINTTLAPPLLSYVYPNTLLDGVSSASDLSGTVAIRALFLHSTLPTFAVAKVRVP